MKLKLTHETEKSLKQACVERFQENISKLTEDISKLIKQTQFQQSYTDILKEKLVNNKTLIIAHATKYNQIVDEYNLIQEEYK